MKYLIKKAIQTLMIPFIVPGYLSFLNRSARNRRFSIKLADLNPQIKDKTFATNFDRHYVYHVAWAVRKVLAIKPDFHTDISSSLYFCSTLSASLPVRFYDFRPAKLKLSGLSSDQADLTNLPFPDKSIKSLSCLHTVEHIGLGRYGDPLDPDGDLKAVRELKRVLAPGGSLLLVVPVGKPKIAFNAHRIYSYNMVRELFSDLKLEEYYLIPELEKEGDPVYNAGEEETDRLNYACGCFLFTKPK